MARGSEKQKLIDACPGCGGPVACGMANGEATCWCFALPAVMPIPTYAGEARCYCSRCLQKMIAEKAKAGCA